MTLICPNCFGDSGLQRRIVEIRREENHYGSCKFHPKKKGIPISKVAKIVDEVFRYRYIVCRDGRGVSLSVKLHELTGANDCRVISALADSLIEVELCSSDIEENFYNCNQTYRYNKKGCEEYSHRWIRFRKLILQEQRFFNVDAQKQLEKIFNGIHLIQNDHHEPAVNKLIPGSDNAVFYRARLGNENNARRNIMKDPATELGPPPFQKSTAGRMNSPGIMAFYGAFDIETCIAELRPAVGQTVITAKFELNRPILVLDTTGFSSKPKSFDTFTKKHIERMKLWKFMTEFMRKIAQPCLPGSEHLDYIPMQVVSEYLTHLHVLPSSYGRQKKIEGIIYWSAQKEDGKNIAIFGKAGMVKEAKQDEYRQESPNPGLKCDKGSVATYEVTSVSYEKIQLTKSLSQKIVGLADETAIG